MIARCKFYPWEKEADFDLGDWKLGKGDYIIVNSNADLAEGEVELEAIEILEIKEKGKDAKAIVKGATSDDIESIKRYSLNKKAALEFAKKQAKAHDLEIKFIDAQFGYDGSRITFGFIASQRVDFRELVKALSRHFQKSIKLIQVGSRDEARSFGGAGSCGRQLCCVSFLKKIESVTLNDAKVQRLDTRGASRLSGVCGRLKCCLSYESKFYEELSATMPSVGQEVITDKGNAKVVDIYVFERKVKVSLPDNTYAFYGIGDIKFNLKKK